MPRWSIGELYVSGPTLMDGYLNDQGKTDAVLIRDTADTTSNVKLYRTGDLVRLNKDGYLEFHGRIDNQVKVRGYRVEIGEIEHVLNEHPAVKEAAIFVSTQEKIDTVLKAVVAVKDSVLICQDELKRFLSKKLPAYMIPAEFYFVNNLPKTTTGKVCRESLRRIFNMANYCSLKRFLCAHKGG